MSEIYVCYYWSNLTIYTDYPLREEYGHCTYYPEYDAAEIYMQSGHDRPTLIHELGHVWQGMHRNDLETNIKWPTNHLGKSSRREDFPEALRIALSGLCCCADESILYKVKQGITGLYQEEIPKEAKEAFVQRCKDEVVRLIGRLPTVPTI